MIEVVPGGPMFEGEGDLLVVPVFEDLTWGPGAGEAAERLGPWLNDYLGAREFTGGAGEIVSVPGGDTPYREVAFVGLGDEVVGDDEILQIDGARRQIDKRQARIQCLAGVDEQMKSGGLRTIGNTKTFCKHGKRTGVSRRQGRFMGKIRTRRQGRTSGKQQRGATQIEQKQEPNRKRVHNHLDMNE